MADRKLKGIPGIALFALLPLLGIFIWDGAWLKALFSGASILLLAVLLSVKRTEKSALADDELFLSFHGTGSVEYHDWGFCDSTYEKEFRWDEIQKVTAFKLDRTTHDDVCLTCLFFNGEEFTIIEGEPGWHQFVKHLEENLPLSKDWFAKIIKPAFKKSEAVIFEDGRYSHL